MKQKKVEKTKMNPTEEDEKNLEKEFGELKEKKVQPQTRTVKLYRHCVGGWIERTVPFNSNFKDGDVISDYNSGFTGDKRITDPGIRPTRDVRGMDWGKSKDGL